MSKKSVEYLMYFMMHQNILNIHSQNTSETFLRNRRVFENVKLLFFHKNRIETEFIWLLKKNITLFAAYIFKTIRYLPIFYRMSG
jgi:hypothetical protein